eukprot:TRINITY_DN7877_c0_g1_i1.p1 TRINITY_DN7877_c0_g1~~TRINITY_DN7877_c0_g1_i1.p1  ORF type:complete len:550 (-),score=127.07 TRINITY_DN7877_c0_g1_i1:146-1795(-)
MNYHTAIVVALVLFCYMIEASKKEQDYYELLGVKKTATDSEIKRAYHKLAVKYHPDKNKDEGAEEMFIAINNAYQILSDPENRKKYDMYGPSYFSKGGSGGGGGGGSSNGNFEFKNPFEFFSNMFGGSGGNFKFSFGGQDMGGFGSDFGGGDFGGGNFGGSNFKFGGNNFGFGQGGGGGKQQAPRKFQVLFSGQQDTISVLDKSLFTLQVSNTEQPWLIFFYVDDNEECQEVAPTIEKLSKTLLHIVNIGVVNCKKSKDLCTTYSVSNYPTVKLFSFGENRDKPKEYKGPFSLSALDKFALTSIPRNVTVIQSKVKHTDFLKSQEPKVLLFSEKSEVPALYLSIALKLRSRAVFGFIPKSSGLTSMYPNVTTFPSLLVISPEGENHIYSSEMQYTKLTLFITQHTKKPHREVFNDSTLYELKKSNVDSLCPSTAKYRCAIFISKTGKSFSKDDLEVQSQLAQKYEHDPLKVMWLSSDNSDNFRKFIPQSEESATLDPILIIYNPKNDKFVSLATSDDSIPKLDVISAFVEKVFSGSEKWRVLGGLNLLD